MASSGMKLQARRAFLFGVSTTMLMLAGCQTGPRGTAQGPSTEPGPLLRTEPGESPKNGVALLVPLTGGDAMVGQSIANAANLALMDSGEKSLRLTVYDTAAPGGAAAAATKAVGDGNRLILGPLLAEDVKTAAPAARKNGVPLIAFSNDESVAGNGVYIMGLTPTQSIERVVSYAKGQGKARFSALAPTGVYGQRATQALLGAARRNGVTVGSVESFSRSAASAREAATRLQRRGGFDALLIADAGALAATTAPIVATGHQLLGTELWASDKSLSRVPALRGAWFAAAPDARFTQLVNRYRARYGRVPYRIASLGYDAVLLAVRSAPAWPIGRPFPARGLVDKGGFAGVDGIFRFRGNGIAERTLEVRKVTVNGSAVISPAAKTFGD